MTTEIYRINLLHSHGRVLRRDVNMELAVIVNLVVSTVTESSLLQFGSLEDCVGSATSPEIISLRQLYTLRPPQLTAPLTF